MLPQQRPTAPAQPLPQQAVHHGHGVRLRESFPHAGGGEDRSSSVVAVVFLRTRMAQEFGVLDGHESVVLCGGGAGVPVSRHAGRKEFRDSLFKIAGQHHGFFLGGL